MYSKSVMLPNESLGVPKEVSLARSTRTDLRGMEVRTKSVCEREKQNPGSVAVKN